MYLNILQSKFHHWYSYCFCVLYSTAISPFMDCVFYIKYTGVRKPSISSPLKDVSVQEGKGVKLECQYTGEPAPQVQWLKNDRSVMPSTIFKVSDSCYFLGDYYWHDNTLFIGCPVPLILM